MSNRHFDIAVIGGSLAARITAVLAAKQGRRVLFLRRREATAPAWFHSSLFLEKLLGTLGGRSCFVAQEPIQVLSRNARVTLSSDIPLAGELEREFGRDGAAVAGWLEQLAADGDDFENFLWENGGLPWPGLKARLGTKMLGMRRKFDRTRLGAPVTLTLGQVPDIARTFVTDLLQGLSLCRVDGLSRGQAALLWTQALRPENLKEPDFSQLLSKRFEQFHGQKAALDDLQRLDYDGTRWTGGTLKESGRFTADLFLLGDTRWYELFAAGHLAELTVAQSGSRLETGDLTGQVSRLLASRVICGGDLPLRLALDRSGDRLQGLVLCGGNADADRLRGQLEQALPFARYELTAEEGAAPIQDQAASKPSAGPLAEPRLCLGANVYCADNGVLLPEAGAAGAALLGWTLVGNLFKAQKQGKG